MHDERPLITILGPTAAGKTALALDVAEEFGGEIVCADSRTVYRGMDIGTAKPTAADQQRVPHHLLDIIDPGESLSAAAFKSLADEAVADIGRRGRVPVMVGGSGLYIDAVLFDYQFPAPAEAGRRAELDALGDDELLELLLAEDPEAFERVDLANRRRVLRALETAGQARSRRTVVRGRTLVLGLAPNKEIIQTRIEKRAGEMLAGGLVEEVRSLAETYGWDCPALSVTGYRPVKEHLLNGVGLEQTRVEIVREHMALYRKQMTWFKRNAAVQWLDNPADAGGLARDFLTAERNASG